MEQAIESLVPLLAQILTHLEALTPPAKPPIATYADLYDEPEAGPPEGELVAAALRPQRRHAGGHACRGGCEGRRHDRPRAAYPDPGRL